MALVIIGTSINLKVIMVIIVYIIYGGYITLIIKFHTPDCHNVRNPLVQVRLFETQPLLIFQSAFDNPVEILFIHGVFRSERNIYVVEYFREISSIIVINIRIRR